MENNLEGLPKILIAIGGLLILTGLALWLFKGKIGFGWFGNLPGDIRIERENFRFYAPLASMLLISIVLSLLFRVVQMMYK